MVGRPTGIRLRVTAAHRGARAAAPAGCGRAAAAPGAGPAAAAGPPAAAGPDVGPATAWARRARSRAAAAPRAVAGPAPGTETAAEGAPAWAPAGRAPVVAVAAAVAAAARAQARRAWLRASARASAPPWPPGEVLPFGSPPWSLPVLSCRASGYRLPAWPAFRRRRRRANPCWVRLRAAAGRGASVAPGGWAPAWESGAQPGAVVGSAAGWAERWRPAVGWVAPRAWLPGSAAAAPAPPSKPRSRPRTIRRAAAARSSTAPGPPRHVAMPSAPGLPAAYDRSARR